MSTSPSPRPLRLTICACKSPPSTAATAVLRRAGPLREELGGGPVVTSPPATLKTVCRREEGFSGSGFWLVAGGGGGGTEKRARSWASVSRISKVISWLERSAFVKILGGGNLVPLRVSRAPTQRRD